MSLALLFSGVPYPNSADGTEERTALTIRDSGDYLVQRLAATY